ncbi:MAG: hypothetical protein WAO95_18435 [Burkholderiales bacterium]
MSMDLEMFMRFALGFLIGACLWAAGNRAHADTIPATANTQTQAATQTSVVKYSTNGGQTVYGWHTSMASLQGAVLSGFNAQAPHVCSTSVFGAAYESYSAGPIGEGYFIIYSTCGPYPNGTYQWVDLPQAIYPITQTFTEYTCPGGWTVSGSNCTQTTYSCPANYTLSGTMCTTNPDAGGTQGPQLCIPATSSPGAGACYNGTLYDYQTASNQFAIGGVQQWCGPTQSSGQPCTASTPQGATGSPTSCPAGQVPGTINGQTVCLGAGDANPAQKVETTTTTTTNAQGQPTGTATTTTTTKDTGTGSTVTTTTRNPDGTATTRTDNVGPNTSKPDVQRFCEQNPDASICKKSTWGGACGAFACDGDAVQCAIAREVYQRNCALFDAPTALSTLGNQVSSGADPQASQNPALEANRTTTSLTGSISQDTFLAPGGLADQQFVVSPRLTVTLPWSQLNYYLSIMGAIVVAFALVFAARIVVGAR